MSLVPQITNYIPILKVQTKHHDEESYFSGEERKSIDAFCSEKEMPKLTPKPNSIPSHKSSENEGEALAKQNLSDNEASTQIGTPQKGQSMEMEKEQCAFRANVPAERGHESPLPQLMKNYNYVVCTNFSFGDSSCKCSSDSTSEE